MGCGSLRFALIGASALLALAAAAPLSAAQEEQVSERVFLVRDGPDTQTRFQMIVQAGCSDEADGECRGLAHYLEHLVLTGRNREHTDIAVRLFPDAQSNGWTSGRATVYVHSVPARDGGPRADLERMFAFYAARLRDFAIGEPEALRERNVVLQEHDWRVTSSPLRRFARRLDRELLPDHPAGQWTIGTKESIDKLTLADAQAFHRSWYAINNSYFVVRADISPGDLKEIAERALAGIEPKQLPARSAANRQPGIPVERKAFREADVQVKRASVTYKKLVRMENGDTNAQRAARVVLGNFLRSRLPGSPHEALVEKRQLAADTPSVAIERVAPKSLTLNITAEVAPDAEPDALLAAIGAYVDGLAGAPPSAELIARLKQRLADGRANEDHDPALVYNRLVAWLASRNTYESYLMWPGHIAAVSRADVAEALAALSGPGRVMTGLLLPAAEEAKQ
jgi:zinc protease